MNTLSLVLYLSAVLPAVGTLLFLLGIFLALGLAGYCFVSYLDASMNSGSYEKRLEPEKYKENKEFLKNKGYIPRTSLILTAFLFLGTSVLIPPRETIYLIAGSELGEEALKTELGQEIAQEVREIIRYQAATLRGESRE